ncbi:MAG: leucyl aminopeptidase [Anaerolineae bacterium]|nr:leucyl aminopeptidase [Anaerolineae bacterium]
MDIQAISGNLAEIEADALLVYLIEGGQLVNNGKAVDDALKGAISEVIEGGDFTAKSGETLVIYTRGAIPAKRVIVVGLGEEDKITLEIVRRTAASGLQKARDLKLKHVAGGAVGVNSGRFETAESAQAMTEGALLGLYQYHGQKSSVTPEDVPEKFDLVTVNVDAASTGIATGKAFAVGTSLTRKLINLPPNILTPAYLAEQAEAMSKEVGLSIKILEKAQMQALKMGALLGVAQGSDYPPHFIVMEHNADKKNELDTVVLVGKGVTFDTGGYSLKTSVGMTSMKADMSGGAAVIGAMRTIAELNPNVHVVGLVPAADNMVSGNAYRPQEVLTASNGKTIEIISTDAEERLLLADALVYAQRYNPAAVVDIATLTGSMIIALGHTTTGFYSNDDAISAKLSNAGDTTNEFVWRLPMYEEYSEALKSDTADTKNSGGAAGRAGGAGVAAHFLSHFVDYNWAHIDMAGMIDNDGKNPYQPKHSAKGYGSRLLTEFVRQWVE